MTSYAEPILCFFCKHLSEDRLFSADGRLKFRCAAYPSGIPDKFLSPDKFHVSPAKDDNGIQFETDGTKIPATLKQKAGID